MWSAKDFWDETTMSGWNHKFMPCCNRNVPTMAQESPNQVMQGRDKIVRQKIILHVTHETLSAQVLRAEAHQ